MTVSNGWTRSSNGYEEWTVASYNESTESVTELFRGWGINTVAPPGAGAMEEG